MAVVGPQNVGLPGYRPGDKRTAATGVNVVGPQNVGLPGYRPGDAGNPYPPAAPPPPPAAPAAPAAPPAPPPLNFDLLTKGDSEYIEGKSDLDRQNTLNVDALKFALGRNSQSAQDSANAHGGLFGGAAANAQKSIAAASTQAGLQLALDYDKGGHGLYHSVFNRLTQQLGGGA